MNGSALGLNIMLIKHYAPAVPLATGVQHYLMLLALSNQGNLHQSSDETRAKELHDELFERHLKYPFVTPDDANALLLLVPTINRLLGRVSHWGTKP